MPIEQFKGRLMRRAIRTDGFTIARRADFLDRMAATCNQSSACKAVGVSPKTIRRARLNDPEFARQFEEAIAAGTERLQQELLAYSLGQLSTGENPSDEREVLDAGPFDPQAARETLKTLAAIEKRTTRHGRPDYATDAEVTRLLADRLDALAKRWGTA